MLNRYSFVRTVVFAGMLLHLGTDVGKAQDVAPAPSPPAPSPSAPPAAENQGEIVDLSGEAMVAPSEPSPAPEPAAPAPTTESSLPSPALHPIEAPPPAPAFRANGVHVSLFGLLGGRFRLTYERLLSLHHGVVVEGLLTPNLFDRLSPDTDDASDPKRFFGYGAGAGYRWHWRGEQGGFVSAMISLEHGSGSLPVFGDTEIRWSGTRTVLSVTPAVGGRWIWGSGFSMVLRGGIGYSYDWVDHDPGLAKKAVDRNENLFLNIEGELSLGYVF